MLTGNISCVQGHSMYTRQHCIGGGRELLQSHLHNYGYTRNVFSTGNIFSANSLMDTCSLRKQVHPSSDMLIIMCCTDQQTGKQITEVLIIRYSERLSQCLLRTRRTVHLVILRTM